MLKMPQRQQQRHVNNEKFSKHLPNLGGGNQHHRVPSPKTMIPANMTYFAPQQKPRLTGSGGGGGAINKNLQSVNTEEEASVLSRYPFHRNRPVPGIADRMMAASPVHLVSENYRRRDNVLEESGAIMDTEQEEEEEADENDITEADRMLQCGDRFTAIEYRNHKRELLSGQAVRRAANPLRLYKSPTPAGKRHSNVYEYAFTGPDNLKAIDEDSANSDS